MAVSDVPLPNDLRRACRYGRAPDRRSATGSARRAATSNGTRGAGHPGGHNPRGSVPFCYLRLSAPIPPDPAYPTKLVTVGNHIRKRRLDLGLLQREVATKVGISNQTLQYWEAGRHEPEFRYLPAIIRFLGYDPRPQAKTLGERVRRTRHALGLSHTELARDLGVDPSTVWRIESEHLPGPGIRALVDDFLERQPGRV